MDEFIEKFRISDLTIRRFNFWTVSVRPQQITLGTLILSLNRECETFDALDAEETEELATVFSSIGELFSKTFKPEKVNYISLMMVDDQVHFHVIPRYEKSIRFNSVAYMDKDWPMPPDFTIGLNFNEMELLLLKNNFIDTIKSL